MTDIEWYASPAKIERRIKPRAPRDTGTDSQLRRLTERGITIVSVALDSISMSRLDRRCDGNRAAWLRRIVIAELDRLDAQETP